MTSQHDTPEAVEMAAKYAAAATPDAGYTAAMLRRLHARAVEAEAEAKELQRTFDLRWKADMRALKRWQDATGRTLTWPDRADAVVFLLEKLDAAEAALATARADALREAARVASMAHLVPPDGGSPTPNECAVAEAARNHILSLIPAQEAQTHA